MIRLVSRLMVLPLAMGLAACDNPVEHEDHPEGLVVLDAQGSEIARYTPGAGASGPISIGLAGTQTFTVRAVAEDGDFITIDGDELSLEVKSQAPDWTMRVESVDQLVLGAPAAGTAELDLELQHEGHPEFQATFTVEAS